VKFYELIEDDEQTGQWRLGKVSDQNGKTVLLDSPLCQKSCPVRLPRIGVSDIRDLGGV